MNFQIRSFRKRRSKLTDISSEPATLPPPTRRVFTQSREESLLLLSLKSQLERTQQDKESLRLKSLSLQSEINNQNQNKNQASRSELTSEKEKTPKFQEEISSELKELRHENKKQKKEISRLMQENLSLQSENEKQKHITVAAFESQIQTLQEKNQALLDEIFIGTEKAKKHRMKNLQF